MTSQREEMDQNVWPIEGDGLEEHEEEGVEEEDVEDQSEEEEHHKDEDEDGIGQEEEEEDTSPSPTINTTLEAMAPDRNEDEQGEEDDDDEPNWDLDTKGWPHMARFRLELRNNHEIPHVMFVRREKDFRFDRRMSTARKRMFVTEDPRALVKVYVQKFDALRVGFDWREVSIWTRGANIGRLLKIAGLLEEVADRRWEEIDEADDEVYNDMSTSWQDTLDDNLQWQRRFMACRVLRFIPSDEAGPRVVWAANPAE